MDELVTCPICKSDDAIWVGTERVRGELHERWMCLECRGEWARIYTFSRSVNLHVQEADDA